jgi:hypothetical protein
LLRSPKVWLKKRAASDVSLLKLSWTPGVKDVSKPAKDAASMSRKEEWKTKNPCLRSSGARIPRDLID